MSKEELPVFKSDDPSISVDVQEYETISRSSTWWSAISLQIERGRKRISLYLWNKQNDGDNWKRIQKYNIRRRQDWEKIKTFVDAHLEDLAP